MRNGPDRITWQVQESTRTPTGGTVVSWVDVPGEVPAWVNLIGVEEIGGVGTGFYGETTTTSARIPLRSAVPESDGDRRVIVTTHVPGLSGTYLVASIRPSRSHTRLMLSRLS